MSAFVKELKYKFSVWFNRRGGRHGTLWEERFKSVLLEDGEAVRFCAAYIDLNPVRAGLCENPEDYRWCSYASALAGDVESSRGLVRYFTDGTVLGSKAFVDGFFERERSRFGSQRESGARAMHGGEWGGVMSLRDLASR